MIETILKKLETKKDLKSEEMQLAVESFQLLTASLQTLSLSWFLIFLE